MQMEPEVNVHLQLLQRFYLKKNAVDIDLGAKATVKAKTTISAPLTPTLFEYDWCSHNGHKTTFGIPPAIDELTQEDASVLDNVSFIHSLLTILDQPPCYTSFTAKHKRADCAALVEKIRNHLLGRQKITKELSGVAHNLTSHRYTDTTMQYIVNYFNSFHLIVLSNNVAQAPKLFSPAIEPAAESAAEPEALILLLFDEQKEIYHPVLYDADKRPQLKITRDESAFTLFLQAVFLWKKPAETKKWAVSDLRAYITFFKLPIDVKLDKKAILDLFQLP
jgi:hypothetical protein